MTVPPMTVPPPRQPLVQVDRISRHFGPIQALREVSFSVSQGEVLGFLGPNGAGKTTTMNIIAGNLAASAGSVTICGQDVIESPRAAKRYLGYLPETPPLYRELTVQEYLRFCARLRGLRRREAGVAATRAQQRCGLAAVGHRLIGNLSKGYRQRVGIAQAIVHDPQVVILDEPTVGLDPIQIREIRELIGELGARHSVILSTHILSEVQALCSHVQIINAGQLVFSSTIQALDTQLAGRNLLLALRRPPPAAQLAVACEGAEVDDLGEGRFRLRSSGAQDPTDALVGASVANDWGLYQLGPEHVSLEQVFLDLTAVDESQSAQATLAA